MKKFLVFLLPVLAAAFLGAAQERLRVISYNIRDGFDTKYSTISKDKQVHYDNFVNFMRERDPDVLCLQELCREKGFHFTADKLKELAAKYGHQYSAFLDIVYGIGVTSKYPIEVVERHPVGGFAHGYLHVRIRGVNFIVTHLSPKGYAARQPEAKKLAALLQEPGRSRYLVMGDFNAHSPYDTDRYQEHTVLTQDLSNEALKDRCDYSVIATMLAVPMIDTLRLFVPLNERMTCAAHFDYFPEKGERIDYIFATPDLRPYLKAGRIWNSVPFRKNSDHAAQELELDASVMTE